jgi:hypothetical protein
MVRIIYGELGLPIVISETSKLSFSSFKHDNMSLKSGFNIQVFLESPRVQRRLPHHADQFCGGLLFKVIGVIDTV